MGQYRLRIGAILLAAGAGTRFGGNKPHALVHGEPSLVRVARAARQAGLSPLLVIMPPSEAGGRDYGGNADGAWETIISHDAHLGIAHSLKTGIAALSGRADAAFILLADMPMIRADTLTTLAGAFTGPDDIIVPFHRGERGNPIGWGAAHWPRLMTLGGDRGGAVLLAELAAHVHPVDVDDSGILRDFDTPEALARINRGA